MSTTEQHFNPRVFYPLLALGWVVMAFGVWGLFNDSNRTNPDQWVRWFVGAALVHDFLIAPAVFALGRLMKSVGDRWRGVLQAAMVASALVVAASFPFLAGYGRRADNASVLPNNYWTGLGWVLAAVWLLAAAILLRRLRRENESS